MSRFTTDANRDELYIYRRQVSGSRAVVEITVNLDRLARDVSYHCEFGKGHKASRARNSIVAKLVKP